MRHETANIVATAVINSLCLPFYLAVTILIYNGCSTRHKATNSDANVAGKPAPVEDKSKKFSALAKEGGSRQELLAALVEKGEIALSDEKDAKHLRARWAYTFANLFAPKDGEVAAKLKSVGGQVTKAESDEVEGKYEANLRFTFGTASALTDDNLGDLYGNFSKLTPKMELVNLRILLDERLVGDLGYIPWQMGEGGSQFLLVFLKEPTMNMNEVRATYGQPSTELTGYNVITYGLIRFFSDEAGKIHCIVFPIVNGRIPKGLATAR